ncbi:MAG TPA: PilZ domain-containing protein [Bryobacteraceae bacterium]|nr:PilZ domain-containing protein [Bryobacteraceae bacterium]
MGVLDWLKKSRRESRAERYSTPRMVAYYWEGGAPREHRVKDISLTGAYLCAQDRWYPGSIVSLTLQEPVAGDAVPAESALSLRCKIVRHGPDGMGVTFMLPTHDEQRALKRFIGSVGAGEAAAVKHRGVEKGQSLVEHAFMVPFLFLLVVNIVNFGAFIYDWIEVANAARAGAQFAVLGRTSGGITKPLMGTDITSLIQQDMASIPGTPTISVCENNNGTLTTLAGTCSTTTTPADPEAPFYVLATVDVTYTYTPLTGTLGFPKLGIYATIPPTTIHRQVVMRILQ